MSEQVWSAYLLAVLMTVALVAHEIVFVVLGIVEPVFLLLSMGCLAMFWVWVAGVVFGYLKNQQPNDIWKLSFLSLLGFLGTIIKIEAILIGFFPLIGLWVVRGPASKTDRKIVVLVAGVVGLLVLLTRSGFVVGFEPTIWGDNLILGTSTLAMLALGRQWFSDSDST